MSIECACVYVKHHESVYGLSSRNSREIMKSMPSLKVISTKISKLSHRNTDMSISWHLQEIHGKPYLCIQTVNQCLDTNQARRYTNLNILALKYCTF